MLFLGTAVPVRGKASSQMKARDEEKVIGRLLKRMTELLTYTHNKLQVVAIDDASSDRTSLIAEDFAKRHAFIEVLHRDKKTGGKGKAAAMNSGLARAPSFTRVFHAGSNPDRLLGGRLPHPLSNFTTRKCALVFHARILLQPRRQLRPVFQSRNRRLLRWQNQNPMADSTFTFRVHIQHPHMHKSPLRPLCRENAQEKPN
jgi:glycosyltransferase involved in cell wall biosynthesis